MCYIVPHSFREAIAGGTGLYNSIGRLLNRLSEEADLSLKPFGSELRCEGSQTIGAPAKGVRKIIICIASDGTGIWGALS